MFLATFRNFLSIENCVFLAKKMTKIKANAPKNPENQTFCKFGHLGVKSIPQGGLKTVVTMPRSATSESYVLGLFGMGV